MKQILLIGNPNCGKTTLFNRITGLNQKTSNLPGTTVEAYKGKINIQGEDYQIIDLPGIYSLFSNTEYEQVVNKHLLGHSAGKPDLVVFVLDASNLRRNLLLFSQVAELGIPSAGILTMTDTANRRNITTNISHISKELGISEIHLRPHYREIQINNERLIDLGNNFENINFKLSSNDIPFYDEVKNYYYHFSSISGSTFESEAYNVKFILLKNFSKQQYTDTAQFIEMYPQFIVK